PSDFEQTAALYALLSEADAEEVRQHIRDAQLIGDRSDRQAAMGILFLRLAELDPQGVLAFLDQVDIRERHAAIYSIFNGWAKYDLEGALDRLDDLPPGRDRQIATNAITQAYSDDPETLARVSARLQGNGNRFQPMPELVALARTNPASAFDKALQITDHGLRTQTLAQIASIWGRMDARAALEHSTGITNGNSRRNFRMNIFSSVAMQDPTAALDLLDLVSTQNEQRMVISNVFSQLSRHDTAEALQIANGLENPALRRMALGQVFGGWAENDPRAAAEAMAALKDPLIARQHGHLLLYHYAAQAPLEALAWAEQVEGRKGQLWQSVVTNLAQQSPEQALAIVTDMDPSPWQAQILANVLSNIAFNDPLVAAAYVRDLPPGQAREQALNQIGHAWAQQDPEAALDWILQQSSRTQANLLPGIAYQIARMDLDAAMAYTSAIRGPARERWIGAIVESFSQTNPYAAAEWVEQYAGEAGFGQWMGTIAGHLAREDPRNALRLIEAIESPDHYQQARQAIAQQWASFDPAAAARWLGDGSVDEDASLFQSVAGSWHQYDPAGAVDWVMGLEAGRSRDAAIQSILGTGYVDPDRFDRLVEAISSEQGRIQAIQSRFHQLIRHDPEGAATFLAAAHLPEQQRQQLQQMLDDSGG
ncbi:MAG: hypothetical protein R3200_12285, partial [Xanthomonadales bacterium]|nr:hypothetical protein [Xanthomonadales bacterium]